MKNILIALALVMCGANPALAQNNMLSANGSVYQDVSLSEITTIFTSNAWTTTIVQSDDKITIVEAKSPAGGTIYFALSDCAAGRCKMMELFAYLDISGLTLSQANDFHAQQALISTLIFLPDRIAISRKTFFQGGVAMDFINTQIGLYLYDVDNVVKAMSPGVIASVNYGKRPGSAGAGGRDFGKIANFHANPVGENAVSFDSRNWRGSLAQ